MNESLQATVLRELGAAVCVCGEIKMSGHSFCRGCYWELPEGLRRRLWNSMSEGYVAAHDEAKDWLRWNTNRLQGAPAAAARQSGLFGGEK